MNVITSKDNEIIKNIKKLKDKKYRNQQNKYIIEGMRLIEEAIKEEASIDKIVVCEDTISEDSIDSQLLYEIAKYDCIYVSEKVFSVLTDVSNPQGILAVINKKNSINEINYKDDIIVILDGIQDPGNLGTILRTVDSANIKQVIVTDKTADAYNPKVVRSTMGAIFRVNVIEADNVKDLVKDIKKHKFRLVATSLQTDTSIYDIDYNKVAIIIGNEANGVSDELMNVADIKIKIPMLGKTESLNASVATGIIIYEYVRRTVG